jgi:hypothetical protein
MNLLPPNKLRALWNQSAALRQAALKVVALVICLIGLSAIAPEKAHAFAIYHRTGDNVPMHAKVIEGNFSANISPGDGEACNWKNKDCNPSGKRDAMLTAQIETDNFTCVVKMPAGGYAMLVSRDRSNLGLPPDRYCQSRDWNEKVIDNAPYGTDLPLSQRDVRFLATADPQYENSNNDWDKKAENTTAQMRQRLQTGGNIRGILIAGDLTDYTRGTQWSQYKRSIDGISRFVYDGLGNHDYYTPWDWLKKAACDLGRPECINPGQIKAAMTDRKRSTPITNAKNPHYSWDWQDVHFVQLNLFPSDTTSPQYPQNDPYGSLSFLKNDLQRYVGNSGRPVVLVQHYGFDDFSIGKSEQKEEWWTEAQRKAYWDAIAPYNVAAIFTGHLHPTPEGSWYIPWNRPVGSTAGPDMIPTYVAGCTRTGAFLDVQMTNDQMTVSRIGYYPEKGYLAEVDRKVVPLSRPAA